MFWCRNMMHTEFKSQVFETAISSLRQLPFLWSISPLSFVLFKPTQSYISLFLSVSDSLWHTLSLSLFLSSAIFYPVVRREPRSQGYSYSLLNGEPRSYSEFPNHLIVFLWVTFLSPFISGYNACIDDCVMGRTQDVGNSFGCWELRKHHHSKISKKSPIRNFKRSNDI